MRVGRMIKLVAIVGVGALALAGTLFTIGRGRGQCPQCGYAGDLSECKHCGWTACLSCWQSRGKYTCPNCGRGNP